MPLQHWRNRSPRDRLHECLLEPRHLLEAENTFLSAQMMAFRILCNVIFISRRDQVVPCARACALIEMEFSAWDLVGALMLDAIPTRSMVKLG